jgi:hypothetical protein
MWVQEVMENAATDPEGGKAAAPKDTHIPSWWRAWPRLILCAVVLTGWFLFGGAVLQALEQPYELEQLSQIKADIASVKESMGDELFAILDTAFSNFPHTGSLCTSWPINTNSSAWTLSGATFFSLQLATSIGYGTQAPRTVGGKIFAMFYSIVGFCVWGSANAIVSGIIEAAVFTAVSRKYKQLAGGQTTPFLSNDQVVLLVEALAVFAWLLLMAAYYQREEGWTFTDALYFGFVSCSTIGTWIFVSPDFCGKRITLFCGPKDSATWRQKQLQVRSSTTFFCSSACP